jgi:hypothetical protein
MYDNLLNDYHTMVCITEIGRSVSGKHSWVMLDNIKNEAEKRFHFLKENRHLTDIISYEDTPCVIDGDVSSSKMTKCTYKMLCDIYTRITKVFKVVSAWNDTHNDFPRWAL